MGNNYYLCSEQEPGQKAHIGKSSAGWCFSVHVIPERGIQGPSEWQHLWDQPGFWIEDEYGKKVTPDEMLEIIMCRAWDRQGTSHDAKWYKANECEDGPFGLMRHKVSDVARRRVRHGRGTWDLLEGEFS